MARIRTVKPEFFRHEELQGLESKHPRIMLFFAGLWCQSDKAGRFRWKPNQIKLDVLPFIKYNPETYLEVLCTSNMVRYYEVDGEKYGLILNFEKHQLIFGSEAKSVPRWPEPPKEVVRKSEEVQDQTEDHGVRSYGVRNQELGNYVAGSDESLKKDFDEARKAYPGVKRGLPDEWQHFRKKHGKNASEIIPLLMPAIQRYRAKIEAEKIEPKFIKHFQGWISDSRWNEEGPQTKKFSPNLDWAP